MINTGFSFEKEESPHTRHRGETLEQYAKRSMNVPVNEDKCCMTPLAGGAHDRKHSSGFQELGRDRSCSLGIEFQHFKLNKFNRSVA